MRKLVFEGVKDSLLEQMNDHKKWGIMTDWRHSYYTMMPEYQAMVLNKFSQLVNKGMIDRSDRPVFWSV